MSELPLDPPSAPNDRYARQARFAPLGAEGQRRLAEAKALVCGCGALGSAAAEMLVRAGVGTVALVDRDFVELSNLHRQTLFDEHDAAQQLPKAIAAAEHLRRINSQVRIEATVADLTASNLAALAEGADVLVDGLDNFDTRYLLNDYAIERSVPWVFGGCIGAEGQSMTVVPQETACLACLLPEPPPAELQPTCETAGVLGPIVSLIASIQAVETLKILSGNRHAVSRRMAIFDLWHNQLRSIAVERASTCRACGKCDFPWLDGRRGASAVVLCGRHSVQIAPSGPPPVLDELAKKLAPLGRVVQNPYLLRLEVLPYQFTIFADGRVIVGGVNDPSEARTLVARYLGG